SRVWGKADKNSDFDLFIIKKTTKDKIERQRELRSKLFPPGLPIDLLIYTPEEIKKRLKMGDFFIRDILKKGKTLYVESKRIKY
ncbi:MAG: nucleotidyltransferase domain-containing protein, partial [bacterium]|nr:nucleotidyltransferase domain-containing protein [bacterium]